MCCNTVWIGRCFDLFGQIIGKLHVDDIPHRAGILLVPRTIRTSIARINLAGIQPSILVRVNACKTIHAHAPSRFAVLQLANAQRAILVFVQPRNKPFTA